MPEEETESIFSAVPESEVGSDEEVEVESEADIAPAMIRPSAHIQEGFISLDMVNVREVITIRSCVMKCFQHSPRCIQVCHEVGVARDHQRHGVPKPFACSQRLEIVHIDPENAVVPTGTRRQSSEKPVIGQVEQVCQWTVAGFVGKKPRSVGECNKVAIKKETQNRDFWPPDVEKRVERAHEALISMGEISAARQAGWKDLWGSGVVWQPGYS